MFDIKNIKDTEGLGLEECSKFLHPGGIFKKIRHYWHFWKRIVKNFISWFPIIWKDCDWDDEFFTDIVLHKLKNMKNFYEKGENVWSVEAPQVAEEIGEVIEILERVKEDNYEEAIDPHFHDWIRDGREHFKDIVDENGETHHIFDSGHTSEEDKERKEIWKQAEENKLNDLKKAYGLIAINLRKWWD